MGEMNYDAMGKEALRAEMRARELSYSKMNNDAMRAALRANDEELADYASDENDFEMSKEELQKQSVRTVTEIVNESDEQRDQRRQQLTDVEQRAILEEAASRATPRTRKGVTVEKDREQRNGIKRPSKGGVCREVWDFCDSAKAQGAGPTAKTVRERAAAVGWNVNNAAIEFYQWRKFNGISGRAK